MNVSTFSAEVLNLFERDVYKRQILGIVDSTNKKCRFHDIEGLLLPIEFERLPKVEIIFGPQACDSEKEEIKELCKEYDNFSFRDSSLSIDDIKKECNNK